MQWFVIYIDEQGESQFDCFSTKEKAEERFKEKVKEDTLVWLYEANCIKIWGL